VIAVLNGQVFKAAFLEMTPEEAASVPSYLTDVCSAEICTMSDSGYASHRNHSASGCLN